MSAIRSIGVPELAGLGRYQEAARGGFSVEQTVALLLRFQWIERRTMATLLARLPGTPEWEVKCAMALHQWQAGEHVEGFRTRIGEMRRPVPALDEAPDPGLERFCVEFATAATTTELLEAIYQMVLPALADGYRRYLAGANLLVDHPSRRLVAMALAETESAVAWGTAALGALRGRDTPTPDAAVGSWVEHLERYLAAAGGVTGLDPRPAAPLPNARPAAPVDLTPRRDDRFQGQYNFEFPPHVIYQDPSASAAERNLALLCKRTLEMDVPEMMASVMVERPDLPWEFHRDYSRQLWDEMRHAMMGSVAFESRGVDWSTIPLNVGFALRLNRHATPLERQIILFAIEQSLMPGETGKRFEYRTAVEAGDRLSELFHDFDWADEVLHAQIGRRWLKHLGIAPEDAQTQAPAIHERTWAELEHYRGREPQVDWWDEFVRRVLGVPSAVPAEKRSGLKILAE
ncbi:MAG: hypothetical protein ACKVZ0_01485 [Gemmatimonadales bacterium]